MSVIYETGPRIRNILAALGKKQAEFASDINIKSASASTICNGKSHPSKQTMMVICQKYGVNPKWLETGEGEMFLEENKWATIAEYFKSLSGKEPDNFQVKLIGVLASLTPDQWKVLEDISNKLVEDK